MSIPKPSFEKHCAVCEKVTPWVLAGDFSSHDYCDRCGVSEEMLEGQHHPGGCERHPNDTHETGFGLAGGGFGDYKICNHCGAVFDKNLWPEDVG